MNQVHCSVGYFVFSLDTELAWGTLDWNRDRAAQTSRESTTERKTIRRLLDLMDEFGVSATWAVTGHLFYEKCEECDECPVMQFKGKDESFDKIWKTRDAMWYGSDIVDMLLSRGNHEIACHGYTHRRFGELSKDQARFEIQEWVRLAARNGITPYTIIFPQGRIGHLDLFQEAGFICYRGSELKHPALFLPLVGKILNQLNLFFSILTPQVYDIQKIPGGLVNIPSSQWLFRINRKVERSLDSLRLESFRLRGTIEGIENAAKENKIIHLWAHPHEFRTEKDFQKLRLIFGHFASHAKEGRLQSITMADLAKKELKTRHSPSPSVEEARAQ